jgi:hypothetical protein
MGFRAANGSSSRPLINGDIQAVFKRAALPSYRLVFSDLNTAVECLNGLDFTQQMMGPRFRYQGVKVLNFAP